MNKDIKTILIAIIVGVAIFHYGKAME